jgi:hypothetical protein
VIQRIIATLITATLYFFFAVLSALPADVADRTSPNPGGHTAARKLSSANRFPAAKRSMDNSTDQEIFVPVSAPVALFNKTAQSWTLTARVIELKVVSIYGKPGTIAQIEYWIEGEARHAWAVVQIEDYYFTTDIGAVGEGQIILLETTGLHVSPIGVNWDACSPDDVYCRYARFVEGGFPASTDYNGLTICPSNMLIYSGAGSSDWINGMLAWKIRVHK